LLRITLLAPDIQEAILEGRQPKGMQPEELTSATPSDWNEQKTRLRFSSHHLSSASDDISGRYFRKRLLPTSCP
jgi:hypothetical protein